MALPRLIIRHSSGLGVLVGASRPEEGEQLTATDVRAAISELKRQFSVTVMDCANTYSEPLLAALESADRILVVCTPELTTLRDVRELQRLFGQALHLGKDRLSFVLNHPSPATGLSREQFERGLEERMLVEIEHAGERAMRPEFARALSKLADELDPASTPQKRGIHFPSLRRAHG
jgi:pilus assembly protein CpaE